MKTIYERLAMYGSVIESKVANGYVMPLQKRAFGYYSVDFERNMPTKLGEEAIAMGIAKEIK